MQKITSNKHFNIPMRIFLYITAFFAIAFGIVFCLRSGIGLSTWDTLHYALYKLMTTTLGVEQFTIGHSTILVASTFTVVVIILNRNFKYIFMAIPILIVGPLIDIVNLDWLKDFTVTELYFQIPIFMAGLALLPLGGSLLIVSNFPAGVFDEFTLAIMRVFKTENLVKTRVIIEISVILTALIVGLLVGIGLGQISIGTIIFSLTVGSILKLYLGFFERVGLYETKQND
jgi:uncharacterized membrane protein YczE